jgi:hypothetical protein
LSANDKGLLEATWLAERRKWIDFGCGGLLLASDSVSSTPHKLISHICASVKQGCPLRTVSRSRVPLNRVSSVGFVRLKSPKMSPRVPTNAGCLLGAKGGAPYLVGVEYKMNSLSQSAMMYNGDLNGGHKTLHDAAPNTPSSPQGIDCRTDCKDLG